MSRCKPPLSYVEIITEIRRELASASHCQSTSAGSLAKGARHLAAAERLAGMLGDLGEARPVIEVAGPICVPTVFEVEPAAEITAAIDRRLAELRGQQAPARVPRYFVEHRRGCIAVCDRETMDDTDRPAIVSRFSTFNRAEGDGWIITDEDRSAAKRYAEKMNWRPVALPPLLAPFMQPAPVLSADDDEAIESSVSLEYAAAQGKRNRHGYPHDLATINGQSA